MPKYFDTSKKTFQQLKEEWPHGDPVDAILYEVIIHLQVHMWEEPITREIKSERFFDSYYDLRKKILDIIIKEDNLAIQELFKQLDETLDIADCWMRAYQKIKDKYEPERIIYSGDDNGTNR